jgi:hypothetical protein
MTDVLGVDIIDVFSFLMNVVEWRGWDTSIEFGGFCRTAPGRSVQSLVWQVVLSVSVWLRQLTLVSILQMAFPVSMPDKQSHAVRIWTFECIWGAYTWSACLSQGWWSANWLQGPCSLLVEFTYQVTCFCIQILRQMGQFQCIWWCADKEHSRSVRRSETECQIRE